MNKAKAGLYNSDTKGTSSGAKNSGFGLHLAHQLAATLDTNINLADLTHSQGVLNSEISEAYSRRQCGTVLFITIPVLEARPEPNDGHVVKRKSVEGEALPYQFNPKVGTSQQFRVLIADDVLMLRKGLVRSVLGLFQKKNVPVFVQTACTAEDVLRVVNSQPYDIIIADNQYAPPDNAKQLKDDNERPHVLCENETTKISESVANFIRSESFSIEDGDGELSGLQALKQLLASSNNAHPTPILILLSGHKFDKVDCQGLIVVQKPLRANNIIPLLEANAQQLIDSGLCVKVVNEGGRGYRILNQRGTQIFSSDDM